MADTTPARKPVSKRLRFEILRRDGFRCHYCGKRGDESGDGLVVDHVIPVALGGDNEPANLVAACQPCNIGKSSISPDAEQVERVAEDALRWADAMQLAALRLREELFRVDDLVDAFCEDYNELKPFWLPNDWENSVRLFAENGLDASDLAHFLVVATGKGWRYFCGCCWNEIRRRREVAQEIIHAGAV